MSIVLATLKSRGYDRNFDVDMSCANYGENVVLTQGDDQIVLDNAQLQQLWEAIEREMKRR